MMRGCYARLLRCDWMWRCLIAWRNCAGKDRAQILRNGASGLTLLVCLRGLRRRNRNPSRSKARVPYPGLKACSTLLLCFTDLRALSLPGQGGRCGPWPVTRDILLRRPRCRLVSPATRRASNEPSTLELPRRDWVTRDSGATDGWLRDSRGLRGTTCWRRRPTRRDDQWGGIPWCAEPAPCHRSGSRGDRSLQDLPRRECRRYGRRWRRDIPARPWRRSCLFPQGARLPSATWRDSVA